LHKKTAPLLAVLSKSGKSVVRVSLNQACTRSLLLYLSAKLTPSDSGKRPHPVKLRFLLSTPELASYGSEEIYTAAQYLHEKGLIHVVSDDASAALTHSCIRQTFAVAPRAPSPRSFVIVSVTAAGLEFAAAVRKDSTWKKLLEKLGSSALDTVLSTSLSELPKFLSRLL
jgi:hypothetical protein